MCNELYISYYSVFVDPEMRRAMGAQAVALSKAVGYTSAGKPPCIATSADREHYYEFSVVTLSIISFVQFTLSPVVIVVEPDLIESHCNSKRPIGATIYYIHNYTYISCTCMNVKHHALAQHAVT